MTLPPNFDKFNITIQYFRNNGFDCLLTLEEQYRCWLRYQVHPCDKYDKTALSTKIDDWWGCYHCVVGNSIASVNIKKLYLLSLDYHLNDNHVTKEFLYDELSKMTDNTILLYFNELFYMGKLKEFDKNEDINIYNNFNESKIRINKKTFEKYCGYYQFIYECNHGIICDFTINVEFNDNVALNIINLLNNNMLYIKAEEYNQFVSVIDFLQINYQY